MVDISSLSLAERQSLYDRLALSLQSKQADLKLTDAERGFWDALMDVTHLGLKSRPSAKEIINRLGREKYARCVEMMDAFVSDAVPPGTKRIEREGVRSIALKSLADYMRALGRPVTPKGMLEMLPTQLHVAVDEAYPGYVAAKIMHKIACMAA